MSPFILKERSIGAAARNPYRPHGQVKYGKWRTVARFDDVLEAEAALRRRNIGLYDRAIFFRHIRMNDDSSGIVRQYRAACAIVRFLLWLNDVRDPKLNPIPME